MPSAPLTAKAWQPDGAASSCPKCSSAFGVLNRKHHCRGCGQIFCGACTTEGTLEQYGTAGPQTACRNCAAPYVHIPDGGDLHLTTSGAEALLEVYNVGSDASDLEGKFDGKSVSLEFVRTSGGLKLRVPIPSGVGSGHTLSLRRRSTGLEGSAKLTYTAPSILRVGELKTEGGDLTMFCENIGDGSTPVSVMIDGQPCEGVTVTQAHKKLSCKAPPGVGVATVRVEVQHLAAETDVLRAAPEVLAVEPREIPLSGGHVVFRGSNFGTDTRRVEVVLPEAGVEGTEIEILEPHTRMECVLPPMPEGAKAGENVRVRVIVAGIHSIAPLFVVYSSSARPAKVQGHGQGYSSAGSHGKGVSTPLPGKDAGAAPSPYANLFATPLQVDRNRQAAGTASVSAMPSPSAGPGAGAGADNSSSSGGGGGASGSTPAKKNPGVVRVGGTISGGGPTLSITPPRMWQADMPDCTICGKGFGLSRRRHHCRICGCCACATCTGYQLQLAPTKPAVRVCTRCHLRVGMLSQMVSIIDAIHALRRALPEEMYDTFKDEVVDAVTMPLGPVIAAATSTTTPGKAGAPKTPGKVAPASPSTQ